MRVATCIPIPNKENDGAGTPEHLNAVGEWLQTNVSQIGNGKNGKGLWCTNCHTQLSRELYQRDNITQAFRQEGTTLRNKSLGEIAKAIGVSRKELEEKYLDPKPVLTSKGFDNPKKSGVMLPWAEGTPGTGYRSHCTEGRRPTGAYG